MNPIEGSPLLAHLKRTPWSCSAFARASVRGAMSVFSRRSENVVQAFAFANVSGGETQSLLLVGYFRGQGSD